MEYQLGAMDISLDLRAARAAREIEEKIKAELLRLPIDMRRATLERVAVDVLVEGVGTPQGPVRTLPPPHTPAPSATPPTTADDAEDGHHWERILAWCRAHPSADGSFRNVDVAAAVYPERFGAGEKSRNVIVATVYSSTLRRSVGRWANPDFALLGRGRFRLATDDDRKRERASRSGITAQGGDRQP